MRYGSRRNIALTAVVGVLACTGDPTGELRNGIDHLVATPSALFLDQATSGKVVVEGVDEQGNALGIQPALGQTGAGITVAKDETFNLVYDENGNLVQPRVATRVRYDVDAGDLPVNSSFEVRVGSKSITIPVRVLPTKYIAALSSATPALGDTVTLGVAAPVRIRPTATVEVGGVPAIVVDVAADGRSIRFVPFPGQGSSPVTIAGITLDFSTGLNLTLPSTTPLTTPAGFAGTDAFATAPVLTIPGAGATTTYVDVGTIYPIAACNNDLGGDCRAYQFTLGATTTFDISVTWQGTTDIGAFFYDGGGNIVDACDGHGNGATGQPEACTITLPAGTYTMVLDDFGIFYDPAEAPAAYLRVDLTGH